MTRQRARLALALAILVTILLAGAVWRLRGREAPTSPTSSNIFPADYVGPETCGKCHEEKYKLWRTHPHSRMNANASDQTVVGDFSGKKIEYDGGTVVFDRVDGRYTMALSRRGKSHRFAVTRTIGSRFQQMYAGVLVDGSPPSRSLARRIEAAIEVKLPFAYSITRKSWLPFTYLEGDGPSPEYTESGERTPYDDMYDVRGFGPWDRMCIWCHNTYPYVERLKNRRLLGFPEEDVALRSGPAEPEHTLAIQDPRMPPRLPPPDLVTVGISCESCHFGGAEHARNKRDIRFFPTSDAIEFRGATPERVKAPRESAYVVNSICRQCHTAASTRYPNSASIDNSGEARDMMQGACAREIRCIDCHNPHEPGPRVGAAPDRPVQIEACVRCHDKYKEADAAQAHTGHAPGSGVTCLDCHMPKIVNGLASVVRTHQISSPTDRRMLAAGAPNACNLCHLDRPLTWTLAALDRQWGVKITPEESWKAAYGGSLDAPTGIAGLHHAHPIVRRVTADAFARSPLGKAELPELISILNDPIATNRTFGLAAIERILGRTLTEEEYSLMAPLSVRKRQAATLAAQIGR
jgi:cytochrome c552